MGGNTTIVCYAWSMRRQTYTVTFPAARHHRPLAGTKLYCLVTEAHVCVNNMARVALDSGEAGIRTRDLLIASPAS